MTRVPRTTLMALALLLLRPLGAQQVGKEWRQSPKRKPSEIVSGMPVGRVADNPNDRGDWLLYWYGGRPTLDYLKFRMGLAQREMVRWPDRVPGRPEFKTQPSASAQLVAGTWRSIGPLKEPVTGSRPDMTSGRLVDIVTHPTDTQILYVATGAGGVFKTTNANFASLSAWNWTNITDSIPSTSSGGSTSVGALAMSPADPNTLYLGMGDREGNTVGNSASDNIGFYKSTDGGVTWSSPVILGSATLTYGILPLSASVVLVGGTDGLYRSGNGGTSFTKITSGLSADAVWSIQAFTPSDLICTQWGTGNGSIYYSTDGGLTWTVAPISGFPGTPTRMTVATSASSATTGWAIASLTTGSFAKGLLKTTDKGHTWTYIAAPTAPGSMFQKYSTQTAGDGGQATYNQGIAVDPADVNKVWVGANPAMYRTLDGGVTWIQMAYGYDSDTVFAHPDYHCSAWAKTGTPILFMGNDGGICIVRDPYRTTIPRSNSSASQPSDPTFIDNRWNQGINSYQVWKFGNTTAASPAGAKDFVVVGLQDNDTRARVDDGSGLGNSTSFDNVAGGDGTAGNIHAVNGNQAMGAQPSLNIFRTMDGWSTANYAVSGITDAGGANAPFVVNLVPDLSDATGNTIYTHSTKNIYKTTNYATSWTALGNSGIDSTRNIRNLGVSKSSPQTLAVVTTGGLGFITTNAGASWTPFGTIPNNSFSMSFVWFDTGNSQIIYAGSVAQVPAANHLWKSTDGGSSWAGIDSNPGFPFGIPVEALINDPTNPNILYAATDLGVYRSGDKGATWSRFGSGFPLVNVKDIYIAPDASFIRAATFGRGVWEITASSTPTPTLTSFNPTSAFANTIVTLTGTNFTGATSVKYNGTSATFNFLSDTSIQSTVPLGATTGPISVTTPGGTATSSTNFTVLVTPPAISSFNPTSGPVGIAVTITGTNLTGASSLTFNSAPAVFTVASPTTITTTVPAGATTGPIAVTTPGGIGVGATFTVTIPLAPTITSFTANPGTILTGSSSTLNWTVNGATSLSIAGVGSVTGSSTSVSPSATTTFVLTASNSGGTVTANATVNVKTKDQDGSGSVDVLDLAYFARYFGTSNVAADLNGDGIVDDLDITIFLTGF